MAEVSEVGDGEIGRRLRTDSRMKSIWQSMQRAKVNQALLDGLDDWQRLSKYGVEMFNWRRRPEDTEVCFRFTLRDQACAAFFVSGVVELGFYRPGSTRAAMRDRAKKALHDPRADAREAMNLAAWAKRRGPYVLERESKNDDDVRGRARALAVETKKIFGQFRYHTVAVTTNVALDQSITGEMVRDWCADLS
jgi:hypothetical protein